MIKTTVIEAKKMVVCELFDTKYDAINQILKTLRGGLIIDLDKYEIPNHFRSAVVCDEEDVFDPREGYKKAKKRLLDKYYHSKNAATKRFVNDLNDTMFMVASSCERNVND